MTLRAGRQQTILPFPRKVRPHPRTFRKGPPFAHCLPETAAALTPLAGSGPCSLHEASQSARHTPCIRLAKLSVTRLYLSLR